MVVAFPFSVLLFRFFIGQKLNKRSLYSYELNSFGIEALKIINFNSQQLQMGCEWLAMSFSFCFSCYLVIREWLPSWIGFSLAKCWLSSRLSSGPHNPVIVLCLNKSEKLPFVYSRFSFLFSLRFDRSF